MSDEMLSGGRGEKKPTLPPSSADAGKPPDGIILYPLFRAPPPPPPPPAPDPRPRFVDNRDGNTMDRALREHLARLHGSGSVQADIATAYFNLGGFRMLAGELERCGTVRLLLGAEPIPEYQRPPRRPADPSEGERVSGEVRDALRKLDEGLRRERDLLPFGDEELDSAMMRLLAMIGQERLLVRRYEDNFLHAKAYILRAPDGGFVSGSSNFTRAGLRHNLELNFGQYDPTTVGQTQQWFEELWAKAVPYDLAALFERLMYEYDPYLIFLKVLHVLYGAELLEEAREVGEGLPLTQFQVHGVWRALRILKQHGGAMVADGVGLGKTFLAGEIIRRYREDKRRVLLVCPAALRESTWKKFQEHHLVYRIECVSYEQLANEKQLGGNHSHLAYALEDYSLVVVDEAHNYRNPDAQFRAAVLRTLLMGRRPDLLLLTATPVNNSLWDLYHLLRFFMKQDAALSDKGIVSIRERFERAAKEDPFDLSPDVLYPIIDATTVKRTRQFVKKHYSGSLIKNADGAMVPITFPKPTPLTVKYDLERAMPGFIDFLEATLAPATGLPDLTLARYQPENYPVGEKPAPRDTAMIGLIRSGLAKRFESSAYALARTAGRMAADHATFLELLDQGWVVQTELLREIAAAEDEDAIQELLDGSSDKLPASSFNVKELRKAVAADQELLLEISNRAAKVQRKKDPKLAALADELARIAKEAEVQASSDEDACQKRKVLIFSYFGDTVDWILEYLLEVTQSDKRLKAYRGRISSVVGETGRYGVSRNEAVWGFAPISSEAPPAHREDKYDILVCTDVLAEGMNLQQARHIVNYDLPWNPQRLVQRHGRVDRIGSKHKEVFLRTFFPDQDLDHRLLGLEARVRSKLAAAAASVGVESAPIEGGRERDQSFAETAAEIEKLKAEKPELFEAGGTESSNQSGEEYRQLLRKALETREREILELPWKAGSGIAKGKLKGHFFCAVVGETPFLRFVPWGGGNIETEIGTCLRAIECREDTARHMPQDLRQGAVHAWHEARRHIHAEWMSKTDPANLQPVVSRLCREVSEFLQNNPPVGVEQRRLEQALQAVEAPISRREENLLRETHSAKYATPAAKAKAIVEKIFDIGLEPFQPPEPLPPVELDEVHLVCWMAVEPNP